MMLRKSLQVLLVLSILSSCKNEPKVTEKTLEFETYETVKKSGEGCHTDDYNCTIISIEVPVATGPEEVSGKINNHLQEHVFSLVTWEENSKAKDYEEFAKEFIATQQEVEADFGSNIPWRAVVFGRVSFLSKNLLSLAVDSEVFTGGAHGYSSLAFLNFDPETGNALDHKDLLTEDFTSFAEQAFRQQNHIPAGEPINSTGFWFEDEKFHLPNNIGILDGKLVLIYNSYEIASYADGEFRMAFPIGEVKSYLKIDTESL